MGIQLYLLDRRMVTLLVGSQPVEIGTLRRSWKLTEIDRERAIELETAGRVIQDQAAPLAVMIADVTELSQTQEPNQVIASHLVLGWDADRSSVTDLDWDYLPVLGYAVQAGDLAQYVLHEERAGGLFPITHARAIALGIHDQKGRFLRKGQPSITECRSVQPYTSSYASANCLLSNGKTAELLTAVEPGQLPELSWYLGKRPLDVSCYRPISATP